MNKFPLLEMLAFFCRHSHLETPVWRKEYVHSVQRIRSRHSKEQGGITKSFYTVETKSGSILNLEFNQEDLLWELEQSGNQKGFAVDRVLAHFKRHKHSYSDAHRIDPLRFEIFPIEVIERRRPIEKALVDRVRPFRFQKGKHGSFEIRRVETKHQENKITEQNLHYVIEDTDGRFYHLIFIPDLLDWRFMQEVDAQFLFVRK